MWENRHLRDLARQSVSSSGTPANRDRRFAIFVGKSEGARATVEAMCNGKRASLLFLPHTPPQPRGHRLRHRRPRHTDQRGSARVKAYVLAADAAEVSADVLRSPATHSTARLTNLRRATRWASFIVHRLRPRDCGP